MGVFKLTINQDSLTQRPGGGSAQRPPSPRLVSSLAEVPGCTRPQPDLRDARATPRGPCGAHLRVGRLTALCRGAARRGRVRPPMPGAHAQVQSRSQGGSSRRWMACVARPRLIPLSGHIFRAVTVLIRSDRAAARLAAAQGICLEGTGECALLTELV